MRLSTPPNSKRACVKKKGPSRGYFAKASTDQPKRSTPLAFHDTGPLPPPRPDPQNDDAQAIARHRQPAQVLQGAALLPCPIYPLDLTPPPHRRLLPARTLQNAKMARDSAVFVSKDLVLIEG